MKKHILYITVILSLLGTCKKKQEFNPSLLVLVSAGQVSVGGKSIQKGDILSGNEILKVEKRSFCDLQILGIESLITIRLEPDSELILGNEKMPDEDLILPEVIKGKAFFNIVKLNGKERFAAKTKAVKTMIKGTQFYIDVASGGKTKLAVIEGSVVLKPNLIQLEDLEKNQIQHLANVQSILDSEKKKGIEVPRGYAILISEDPINKMNKTIELIAYSKEADPQVLKNFKPETYFTKEEIAELTKSDEEETKEIFLELDPIPLEYLYDNPEKLKWIVQSRIEKINEPLSKRFEKYLEQSYEILILEDGRRLKGIIFQKDDKFFLITPLGTEFFPREKVIGSEHNL